MEERKIRKFDPKIQAPIQFMQIVPSVGIMNAILREYTKKVCMQSREQNSFLQLNQKLANLSQKFEEYSAGQKKRYAYNKSLCK